MIRKSLAGVTAITIACVIVSCGPSAKSKTMEVVLVTKALDSEWWQRVKAGAEAAGRGNPDVKVTVLAPEREVNVDQQVGILENQITKRVAAIAVAPTGAAEVIPVLDRARAAGIPVVVVDTDIEWAPKLSYVGGDNQRAGRMAGEYIAKLLGGQGKVAVIRGILGVTTHEDRLSGFKQGIANSPGVRLVAVQPANSERTLGMSVMENFLTSHPDLRAVFATNDQMALGAAEAIAARKLTGKVAIVGIDATWEAVRAVQAGALAGDIAMYPEQLGSRSVEAAIKAARGQVIPKRIDTDEALVTKENAPSFLRQDRLQ